MKGYLTSYVGLFQTHPTGAPRIGSIEIPLIQRDYAQGRPGPFVEEIRSTFLEVLLEAIAGGEPVGLDFVYGRVEAGTLHPLDGQQRLTTVFLLHWYLASTANRVDPNAAWTRFTYETRPSARRFCQRLVANAFPKDEAPPSKWISDQEWYLHVWTNDPTIQAMLVMVDAIHEAIGRLHPGLDADAAWGRLTDEYFPAVSFYLLPLADMDSDDDLYIKMNSRGKPLTAFEQFKARFEQDIKYSGRDGDFANKIDGAWADLLWPIHGGDNIVDDEFMRYIDFITEICELRESRLSSGRLGPRARAVFGPDNRQANEHLDFLFDAFDGWEDYEHISSIFEGFFSTSLPGDETYHWQKVPLFGATSSNLFEQCCRLFDSQLRGYRAFTLQQSLLLYAVLLHLIRGTADFTRRLRVLRNLIAASEDEVRRQDMPTLLKDVEEIIVNGDLDAVSRLSSHQVNDERLKQQFLEANPSLTQTLFRLEDHPILRGGLGSFAFDGETFRQRAEAFEAAFANPANWQLLTGALLATGDYQRQRPNSTGWQFGTSSTANEAVWRYLLTDAPRANLSATRTVLGEFLDALAASGSATGEHLAAVVSAWLGERMASRAFDWRYYLVKYPSMREGATGIYFGVGGVLGYSMCMLRTTRLSGWYRDPILLELWRSSGVGNRFDDPWFTGYDTDPRWLRLVRSGVGMRSIARGFALQRPDNKELGSVFDGICDKREDVVANGGELLLTIPQEPGGGVLIDSRDRVEAGAALLKELVQAGL